MNESAYRDGLAGRRTVLAELEGRLQEARDRVSAFDRALWPEHVRDEIQPREELVATLPRATLDEMLAFEPVLVALTDAYLGTLDDNARRRRIDPLVPFPPSNDPQPYLLEEPWMLALRARLQQFAGSRATVRRLGDADYATELVDGPIAIDARVRRVATSENGVFVVTTVRTPMPWGLPTVRISPENVLHRIGGWVGLVREAEIGDPEFDSAFLVQAPSEIATLWLDREVRRTLLDQVRCAPVVIVDDGHADVRWASPTTTDFVVEALERQLRIARALRRRVDELCP